MSDLREFDLVIFGATGYAGYFMVRELVLSIDEQPDEYRNIRWAIAGRNIAKLEDTLIRLGKELGRDLSSVEKIQADAGDEESLQRMAKRTALVVNVVGPYNLYGRPVVEACVEAGTHHIDISGEMTYIEEMQIEYDLRARANDCLIISTCGWDSIPNDIGLDYLKTHFDGKLHSVESFMCILPGESVSFLSMCLSANCPL